MTELEKSLKLAELMGWEVSEIGWIIIHPTWQDYELNEGYSGEFLHPYKKSMEGLAQFAAILLKFPEFIGDISSKYACTCKAEDCPKWMDGYRPTQSNILDEILRMNGDKDD